MQLIFCVEERLAQNHNQFTRPQYFKTGQILSKYLLSKLLTLNLYFGKKYADKKFQCLLSEKRDLGLLWEPNLKIVKGFKLQVAFERKKSRTQFVLNAKLSQLARPILTSCVPRGESEKLYSNSGSNRIFVNPSITFETLRSLILYDKYTTCKFQFFNVI